MHKKFIQKFTSKDPVVIYNPIDYIPQQKVKNTIPHIGFVGRLVSLKGVDLLIQALKQLEDKKWTCTIVWEGDQRERLEQLVHKLWLTDRITFVWADDRKNWLHKFDIFINPSYQEGLPTTVVEALIAGCVVVATDVGGISEISNNVDLLLCKPGNIDELLIRIDSALQMPNSNGWLSEEDVAKKFSRKYATKSYLWLYDDVISGK